MKHYCLFLVAVLIACTGSRAQTLTNCAACATQIVKPEQVNELSIDELRFLMNDLFARKGYKFEAGDIDHYYTNQQWYKPKKNNKEVVFNDTEKQNIRLFQNRTVLLKQERENLLKELKALQQAVKDSNKQELTSRFDLQPKDIQFPSFRAVMKKLDLSDLNWFKHLGLYTVTTDNGEEVISYEIRIDKNKVQITYNQQGGSHIAENASLYPGEYDAPEYAYFWIFEFNGKLRFVKMDVAG